MGLGAVDYGTRGLVLAVRRGLRPRQWVYILMAFCGGLYAEIVGGFRHYDPKLLRIFGAGMALSVVGLGFSIMGLRQRNPVRWHAVGCSLGMIAFWFLSAMME